MTRLGVVESSTTMRLVWLTLSTAILLLVACSGGDDATPDPTIQTSLPTTAPVGGDSSSSSVEISTNTDGEGYVHDSIANRDVTIRVINAESQEPVANVTVYFATNGRDVLAITDDPQGEYAPGLTLTSYDVAYRAALVVANLGSGSILANEQVDSAVLPFVIVVALAAYSAFEIGQGVAELTLDPPRLLEFTAVDTKWCVTPTELENIVGTGIKVALLLPLKEPTTRGVVMALLEDVGTILVERGIIASVTETREYTVRHFAFGPQIGLNPLPIEVGPTCDSDPDVPRDTSTPVLRAIAIDPTTITLEWSGDTSGVSAFIIWYGGPSCGPVRCLRVNEVGRDERSYTYVGAVPGSEVCFQVTFEYESDGSEVTNVGCATTPTSEITLCSGESDLQTGDVQQSADLDRDGTQELLTIQFSPGEHMATLGVSALSATSGSYQVVAQQVFEASSIASGGPYWSVWHGDLTGDGSDEAVLCIRQWGANDQFTSTVIFSYTGGSGSTLFVDDRSVNSGLSWSDSQLMRVEGIDWALGDRRIITCYFAWDGTQFALVREDIEEELFQAGVTCS